MEAADLGSLLPVSLTENDKFPVHWEIMSQDRKTEHDGGDTSCPPLTPMCVNTWTHPHTCVYTSHTHFQYMCRRTMGEAQWQSLHLHWQCSSFVFKKSSIQKECCSWAFPKWILILFSLNLENFLIIILLTVRTFISFWNNLQHICWSHNKEKMPGLNNESFWVNSNICSQSNSNAAFRWTTLED